MINIVCVRFYEFVCVSEIQSDRVELICAIFGIIIMYS